MEAVSTSDASERDLTVQGDDAELSAELSPPWCSVRARVHVAIVAEDAKPEEAPGEALPSFFASFDGPSDLAARSGRDSAGGVPRRSMILVDTGPLVAAANRTDAIHAASVAALAAAKATEARAGIGHRGGVIPPSP